MIEVLALCAALQLHFTDWNLSRLKLDNQVFSNLLIFILHLIAKINDLRGVDVKTVRIHQKT